MGTEKSDVLYLSYDGLTDPLGQSQILPYLSGLAKEGYHISIISFEKPERFRSCESSIRSQCSATGIDWRPQIYHKRPPVFSTLYDLILLWRVARKIVRDNHVKIVHCRSYLTALIGLRLKHKLGVKLIFDMRGFWADERIEGGIWSLENPIYRIIYNYFKRAERRLVKESDCVIVLTQAARDEISEWKLTNHIEVIPCCVDLDLFTEAHIKESDKMLLRSSLGIAPNDFVLLYLGSLGTWYMTDEMLAFYDRLRTVRADAKFLILTPDMNVVSGDGIITKTVQRAEVPRYIAIANASICFIKPSFSKKGSSATKMAEVLAMDVPVISNSGWGDQDFLQRHVNGLFITSLEDNVPDELLLYKETESTQTVFFRDYFSLERGVEKYRGIYLELLRDHSS